MEGSMTVLDFTQLLADVRQESDSLLECLGRLHGADWDLPTPAQGWSIRDQVSHLAFFDDMAHLALTNRGEFRAEADRLIAGGVDFPDRIAAQYRPLATESLVGWFADSRAELLTGFAGQDPKRRVPWFGPDMSVASSATARLMETWAHGQDIYDAVGVAHPDSPGLRSIAHLGVATFAFAHTLNGREVPTEPVRIELHTATGEVWTWGPEGADNHLRGPAEDFVLAVTQRRHWTDTALCADGDVATAWLDIAQAFAGAPSAPHPRTAAPR
jgi:uncharacterized protein (TIGR03084 family)